MSLAQLDRIERLLSLGSFTDFFPISDRGGFDSPFGEDSDHPILAGVEFRSSGTFVFKNIYGTQRTVKVDTGRVYPVFIREILSSTTIPESDIYGYISRRES